MSWQTRLKTEREQLSERAFALSGFLDTKAYDELGSDHKAALLVQGYAMKMYADALDMRMELIDG